VLEPPELEAHPDTNNIRRLDAKSASIGIFELVGLIRLSEMVLVIMGFCAVYPVVRPSWLPVRFLSLFIDFVLFVVLLYLPFKSRISPSMEVLQRMRPALKAYSIKTRPWWSSNGVLSVKERE
jgi:hypothetical protein